MEGRGKVTNCGVNINDPDDLAGRGGQQLRPHHQCTGRHASARRGGGQDLGKGRLTHRGVDAEDPGDLIGRGGQQLHAHR